MTESWQVCLTYSRHHHMTTISIRLHATNASEALLVSGTIARASLGARAVRDLVQHVGCYIEHATMLFSRIVSLIRVFLFCRAGNRHY